MKPVLVCTAGALLLARVAAAAPADVAFGIERIDVLASEAAPVRIAEGLRARLVAQGVVLAEHDLDAPQRLEDALSDGLPADPAAARQDAERRVAAIPTEALRARIERAHTGVLIAATQGIERLPAIAFDLGTPRARAIVGVADLEQALMIEARWRAGR